MTETRAPLLPGQFSGPATNAPRSAPLPSKPEEEAAVVPPAATEKPDEALATIKPKTKEEKEAEYLKGLESVGIDRVQARTIQESVLVNRYYAEEFPIGKLKIRVRTRGYADVQRAMHFLEVEAPTYNMAIQDLIARYNMAASLERYGETEFEFPQKSAGAKSEDIEAAFHRRLDFIQDLPTVVVDRLMKIVHEFDLKMAAVFNDGAPEDF